MEESHRHYGLRRKLVNVLKTKGISDPGVLEAIGKVPRHAFLDKAFIETAYEDRAFPIGEGQTISHPYTVAYQTQLLEIRKGDRVLEIGTGSGYQAAVLAEMGAQVYSIERIKKLYDHTKPILKSLNYKKIMCFYGDGFLGLPDLAPFDKIIITAAAPEIPEDILRQLKIGGIIIIPYGEGEKQLMLKITRKGDFQFEQETLDTFSFVPMLKGTKEKAIKK
ncbi:MAG: protein-L-isoaspartate(D-aspartate) O-methyltransferase [Chitinophagales bacterium]|nr:protein-L-isoaspartate(D-aspartate) O-methyltransferase [Chitinophagales bacterium]